MTPSKADEMEAAAQYIVDCMKNGELVTKQDQKFLASWLSMKKAQDALANGKSVPRAGNAGKRKIVPTGRGR